MYLEEKFVTCQGSTLLIEVAKEDIIIVLKENNEKLANDNEVKKLLKCRRDNRRFNEANDLLHIMIKLLDVDRLPVILLPALEDTNIPAVRPESNDVTLAAKVAALKSFTPDLTFTTETTDDFEGSWLPTLDTRLRFELRTDEEG